MLKVDYAELEFAARTLLDQGDIFEECINTLSGVVGGLSDIWKTEICKKYVSEYNEAKKILDDVRDLIRDMAEQMQTIASHCSDTDGDIPGQI